MLFEVLSSYYLVQRWRCPVHAMSTRVREETKACSRSELIFAPSVQICQPLFLKDVDEYISSENRKKRF